MSTGFESAVMFGKLLRENAEAARFYDHCTPRQRSAILLQLQKIQDPEEVRAFVSHLPSAAL